MKHLKKFKTNENVNQIISIMNLKDCLLDLYDGGFNIDIEYIEEFDRYSVQIMKYSIYSNYILTDFKFGDIKDPLLFMISYITKTYDLKFEINVHVLYSGYRKDYKYSEIDYLEKLDNYKIINRIDLDLYKDKIY